MTDNEQQYLELLREINDRGEVRSDRTGVGTKSLFGTKLEFDLKLGFPLLTTKKMFFKGIIEELLFFLRGEHDTKKLENVGVNIWRGNTTREFLDSRGMTGFPEGSLGVGYGVQWRHWGGKLDENTNQYVGGIDQIANLINTLKNNPNDRRMIVSAYNVGEMHNMALPPCHYSFQCYVRRDSAGLKFLDLMWNQRSVDSFLGLPFNIASYAALTHILARTVNMFPGKLTFIGGDTHIYMDHVSAVEEQIMRDPTKPPTLTLNQRKQISSIQDIEKLTFDDFLLEDYYPQKAIKAKMAI
jgi:thymidylate synthase